LQRNRIDELAVGPSTTNEGKRKPTKKNDMSGSPDETDDEGEGVVDVRRNA
jgi:hypothetical protein